MWNVATTIHQSTKPLGFKLKFFGSMEKYLELQKYSKVGPEKETIQV